MSTPVGTPPTCNDMAYLATVSCLKVRIWEHLGTSRCRLQQEWYELWRTSSGDVTCRFAVGQPCRFLHISGMCPNAAQVVVVDVEDRDDSVWHNLTAYDGGLSGWRLLWDRWCPIPALRHVLFESPAGSGCKRSLTYGLDLAFNSESTIELLGRVWRGCSARLACLPVLSEASACVRSCA